jgi:hypothetical protein
MYFPDYLVRRRLKQLRSKDVSIFRQLVNEKFLTRQNLNIKLDQHRPVIIRLGPNECQVNIRFVTITRPCLEASTGLSVSIFAEFNREDDDKEKVVGEPPLCVASVYLSPGTGALTQKIRFNANNLNRHDNLKSVRLHARLYHAGGAQVKTIAAAESLTGDDVRIVMLGDYGGQISIIS